jgi:hypothetical protein
MRNLSIPRLNASSDYIILFIENVGINGDFMAKNITLLRRSFICPIFGFTCSVEVRVVASLIGSHITLIIRGLTERMVYNSGFLFIGDYFQMKKKVCMVYSDSRRDIVSTSP